MNPTLVLNEDEKKERFKKHLEKKDKRKYEESSYFQLYPRNVDFFNQEMMFNNPLQTPMFWDFEKTNMISFERKKNLLHRQNLPPCPDLEPNFNFKKQERQKQLPPCPNLEPNLNFKMHENADISQISKTPPSLDECDPFLLYERTQKSLIDEVLEAQFRSHYEKYSTRQGSPDTLLSKSFHSQRSFLNKQLVKNKPKNEKFLANPDHLNVDSIERVDSCSPILQSESQMSIFPELLINSANLDRFKLNKPIKLNNQPQVLDSDKYLHKKFNNCTDRSTPDNQDTPMR